MLDSFRNEIVSGSKPIVGACSFTNGGRSGCFTHDKGSLPVGQNGINSLEDCASWCNSCTRCRYISFSAALRDCSWFVECRMHTLLTISGGEKFVTLRIRRGEVATLSPPPPPPPWPTRAGMSAADSRCRPPKSYDSQLVNRCNLDWKKLARDVQSNNETLRRSRLLPCNETDCINVHAQEAELMARNSSIAFGFITRDGMDFLMRNLPFMIRLGSLFARFWLLFSENDSTDGTKELLIEYGRRYPQVQGDLLQGKAVLPSVKLCPNNERNCEARIQLLSQMRQLVYERALRLLDVMDAFVMIDIDFVFVDIPSFLQMFYAGRRLSAAAIAGQSMYRNSREDCQAYDLSALVPYEAPFHAIKKYCFGRIHSAFGGLTIYFADALREASPKPSYTWWNDRCE